MDDFTFVGKSVDWCLSHLAEVLKTYEDWNIVLSCEKMSLNGERRYCIWSSHVTEGDRG